MKIPLHKRALDFKDDINVVSSEYNIFYQIEDWKCNLNIFESGYFNLDRYSDIKPYKHNKISINNGKRYINASPINIGKKEKYFISTQGPKPETIEDFWTMVYENNSNVIVMLCNVTEGGRIKCENYWEKPQMKKFSVEIQNEEKSKMHTIRTLKLKIKEKNEERIINQIHFTAWPDHGIPDISDGKVFQDFCEINQKVDELNNKNNPMIVHCSAGVGRTGTFVSMYLLEKEINEQINAKKEYIRFNIFNLVRKIKEMRMYMVQSEVQYEFIYAYVKYLLINKNI